MGLNSFHPYRIMKTIALICTSVNELGGKNNHMRSIYKGMSARGWKVYLVLCSKVEKELKAFMLSGGVASEDLIFLTRWKKWFFIPFIFELKGVLAAKKIDIVHSFQIQSDVFAAIAARLAKRPCLLSYYESQFLTNDFMLKNILYKSVNALVKNWFGKTVVVSNGLKKEIAKDGFRPHERIEVIHIGIDPPFIKEFHFNGLMEKKPIIGTIGRFSEEKALKRFVNVMPYVLKEFPGVKFILVGKGPEEKELKARVSSLGINASVTFKPWTDNVYKELEGFDIFVMTSIREGCPFALLEAMAVARPCVASNIEGIKDIIQDKESGILVNTEDVKAFSGKIIDLCRQPQQTIALGMSGYARVIKSFTVEEEMSKIHNLYMSVVK